MKKSLLIFLLLSSLSAAAQSVRVTDFRQVASGTRDPRERASHIDRNGEQCAMIRVLTDQDGWTFDAGLAGIVDTRTEKGAVCLYIPSSARALSFGHPTLGVLRNWNIPQTLVPGVSYELKLKSVPTPVHVTESVPKPAQSRPSVSVPGPSQVKLQTRAMQAPTPHSGKRASQTPLSGRKTGQKCFCDHFLDAFYGHCISEGEYYDSYVGLRYSFMKYRVGPYASISSSTEGDISGFAGACVHLLPEQRAASDIQMYAGLGIAEREFIAGEVGIRFAWKTDYRVSRWDFGVGVQIWNGCVMPTASVGLCIWGFPVAIGIGLVCTAAGGM